MVDFGIGEMDDDDLGIGEIVDDDLGIGEIVDDELGIGDIDDEPPDLGMGDILSVFGLSLSNLEEVDDDDDESVWFVSAGSDLVLSNVLDGILSILSLSF